MCLLHVFLRVENYDFHQISTGAVDLNSVAQGNYELMSSTDAGDAQWTYGGQYVVDCPRVLECPSLRNYAVEPDLM